VGCGGARGALGCGREAAEVANGDEQDCGGALVTVAGRRRKRGGEMRPREEGKEVEEGSWTRCKTKRSHRQAGSSCWRPAARRGGFGRRRCDVAGRGKRQRGRASGGRASWEPCGAVRWRGAAGGQRYRRRGAAGGAAVKQRGTGERKTMRTYPKFSKSARVSL
jgi:hypothetical protein